MICYFNRNETNFAHNGLGVLDDHIIDPVVTEELNGIFKLEFDYPLGAHHADGLLQERIVRCPVPNMTPQLFRISERESTIGGLFHVVAYHVFYDLVQNLIEDTFVVNRNGQQAIQQILNAGQFSHPFTGGSNITVFNSARIVRHNIAETLLDGSIDNGFMSRWGGEIVRDNFHVAMQRVRGSDNGVAIRDKKNLTGYRANVDFGTVVTRIMPQGFDGLFLPERYVDSPRIGSYLTPRIRVIEYSQVRARVGRFEDNEDAFPLPQAHALLRTLAQQEYSEHRIDLPTATYEIEFAPLERTEEYKGFAALETVNIGDTVRVIHEEDGLDISSRVVSYQYDPLAHSYIAVTLGSDTPKFTNVARDIQRIETGVNMAKEQADFALQSANGKNTNFYGSAEPRNPRIGDVWFRENGNRLELWVFETRDGVTQWFPLLTDLTQEELRQATEAAKAAAEAAEIAGQKAYEAGQAARDAAEQAKIDAQDAVSRANDAFDNAMNAINDVSGAISQAESAIAVAGDAFNRSVRSSAVTYAVSTNGTTPPTSGWQTVIPTTSAGQFLWTRTVLTLQDNSTVTSFSVARHGQTGAAGATGAPGSPGANAPIITAVREQYYLSTSNTTQIGSSWSDTVPMWINGRFYWTRIVTTFSNGTTTNSTPVLANGLNNSLVTALEARTLSQNLETTVTQHATAIAFNAKSVTNLSGRLIQGWERHRWNTGSGVHINDVSSIRGTHDIAVTPGEQFIGQEANGASRTFRFFWYNADGGFISHINTANAATAPANAATLRVSTAWPPTDDPNDFTGTVIRGNARANMTNLFARVSTAEATLTVHAGQIAARATQTDLNALTGRVTTAESTLNVLPTTIRLAVESHIAPEPLVRGWERHRWNNSTGGHINDNNAIRGAHDIPTAQGQQFIGQTMNGEALAFEYYWYDATGWFINATFGTSAVATAPANAATLRVANRNHPQPPANFTGTVIRGNTRINLTQRTVSASTILMQNNFINLRVAKNDVINQINISTEEILIAGNKIRITGQTTIDNAVIGTAQIADLAVTNVKIANLAVNSAKIADLAVTNAKIGNLAVNTAQIANLAVTTGKIVDLAVTNAKIATLDAAKITTGTLNANRIGANSITANHVTTNFLQALTGNSAIRITGTTISYWSGSNMTSQINANGFELTRDNIRIGRIGTNNMQANSTWRGLVFDLENAGNYMAWSWRMTASASTFTTRLAYYRSRLQNGMEQGFHFDDVVYIKSGQATASGATIVRNNWGFWTFGSVNYLGRVTTTSRAGVALGGNNLILGSQGSWVDFNQIRAICAAIANRRVFLPASSAGLSSWWDVTIPSMTTWTT